MYLVEGPRVYILVLLCIIINRNASGIGNWSPVWELKLYLCFHLFVIQWLQRRCLKNLRPNLGNLCFSNLFKGKCWWPLYYCHRQKIDPIFLGVEVKLYIYLFTPSVFSSHAFRTSRQRGAGFNKRVRRLF